MGYCPSQDWDRYCAQQDQPVPVGSPRTVRSAKPQHCASCYGRIEVGQPHQLQPMLNDVGLFCSPMRLHLDGQCTQPDDWELGDA